MSSTTGRPTLSRPGTPLLRQTYGRGLTIEKRVEWTVDRKPQPKNSGTKGRPTTESRVSGGTYTRRGGDPE